VLPWRQRGWRQALGLFSEIFPTETYLTKSFEKKLKKTVAAVLPFLQVHYVGCKHGEPQSQYSYSIASQSLVSAPARTLHRLHKLTAASIRSFERGFTASDACSFLVATIERYSFSDTCC
jgi:hypothetical protein